MERRSDGVSRKGEGFVIGPATTASSGSFGASLDGSDTRGPTEPAKSFRRTIVSPS